MRFIKNLLPLLQRAPALRRVLTVAGGGVEGPLDSTDFSALRVPLLAMRGHLCTLISLGLEAAAKNAPDVTFVHDYPGTVDTALSTRMEGIKGVIIRAYIYFLGRWVCVPIEESGERHLYLMTSARYPPLNSGTSRDFEVPLSDGVEVSRGSNGQVGSGVYSVGWDGESLSLAAQNMLAGYREQGMVEEIWQHTESEFQRIAG